MRYLVLALACSICASLHSQIVTTAKKGFYSMEIERLKEIDFGSEALYQVVSKQGFVVKEDSILISTKLAHSQRQQHIQVIHNSGGSLRQVVRNTSYFAGYCQIDSLLKFNELLADIPLHIDLHDNSDFTNNEGPTNTNSITYETGGATPNSGAGITIAIVDGGTEGYADAITQGVVPVTISYFDCSSGTCLSQTMPSVTTGAGGPDHGTNVAQIIFDHAPAANYIFYRGGGSPLPVGTAAAIQHAVDTGVDIISTSLSGYCTGWNDNSGVLCSAVNTSGSDDVLMFFSSGNRNGGGHWQGSFVDSDGDGLHEWNGGDETNSRTTPLPDNASFNTRFQCNSSLDVYAVQFVNENTGAVLQTFDNLLFASYENCRWQNLTGGPINIGVRVISKSSSFQPDFEMHVHNAGVYEYSSSQNQTSSPANCVNNPNVLSVAAVTRINYSLSDPPIDFDSSQGPSNNGASTVDLTGPTDNTILNFDAVGNPVTSTFGGTSCATPNCAGATAAFWSKHPNLSASELRQIIVKKAALYKDWGSSGNDNAFGHGGIFLFNYDNDNIYVDQHEGTNNVVPSNGIYPWDNLKDIENLAPSNSNVILLTNDNVSAPNVIRKNMLITAPVNALKVID